MLDDVALRQKLSQVNLSRGLSQEQLYLFYILEHASHPKGFLSLDRLVGSPRCLTSEGSFTSLVAIDLTWMTENLLMYNEVKGFSQITMHLFLLLNLMCCHQGGHCRDSPVVSMQWSHRHNVNDIQNKALSLSVKHLSHS